MKQRIFPALRAIIVCLVLVSCAKTSPAPQQPTPLPKPILNLIADEWQQNADGRHLNTFSKVLTYAPYTNLDVYITDSDNTIQISQGGIVFMNGTISYEAVGSDLVLKYESFDPSVSLPFTKLTIQVIFQ